MLCLQCNKDLDVNNFIKCPDCVRGYKGNCKECTLENNKKITENECGSKICCRCKLSKPHDAFYMYKNRPSGACIECKLRSYKEKPLLTEKKCPVCKQLKSSSEFALNSSSSGGLDSCCKGCKKERRFRNRDRIIAKYYSDKSDPVKSDAMNFSSRVANLRKIGAKVTKDQVKEMMDLADGKCAICKNFFESRFLCIDHCHKTGLARGVICKNCNSMLGMGQDNIQILMEGVNYLKKFTKTSTIYMEDYQLN